MSIETRATRKEAFEKKQLTRLLKERAKPKSHFYLWYMLFILALIYIVDEICTNLPNSLQTELNVALNGYSWANSNGYSLETLNHAAYGGVGPEALLKMLGDGLSKLSLITLLSNMMLIFSLFYRPLADRHGRKIFLFVNTLGISSSCLLFFTANNIFVYAIALFALRFFVTPDQQVVYLFEIAPEKHRNAIYSLTKGVAELGLVFVALLRRLFLDTSDYQSYKWIFLTMAVTTFIVSLIALFFARESDVFLNSRIAYLSKSKEERIASEKEISTKQGGFLAAVRYTLKTPQIRYICIATGIAQLCYACCNGYGVILNNGFLGMGGLNQAEATDVGFYFPFTCALITMLYGFVSDKWGRKITSIVLLSSCTVFYLFLCLGLQFAWPTWLIGLVLGCLLGADWSNGDVLSLLAGESAPTNLRASIMASWSLFYGVGMILSQGLAALAPHVVGLKYLSLFYFFVCIPAWALSLFVLILKVKETKGMNLSTSK